MTYKTLMEQIDGFTKDVLLKKHVFIGHYPYCPECGWEMKDTVTIEEHVKILKPSFRHTAELSNIKPQYNAYTIRSVTCSHCGKKFYIILQGHQQSDDWSPFYAFYDECDDPFTVNEQKIVSATILDTIPDTYRGETLYQTCPYSDIYTKRTLWTDENGKFGVSCFGISPFLTGKKLFWTTYTSTFAVDTKTWKAFAFNKENKISTFANCTYSIPGSAATRFLYSEAMEPMLFGLKNLLIKHADLPEPILQIIANISSTGDKNYQGISRSYQTYLKELEFLLGYKHIPNHMVSYDSYHNIYSIRNLSWDNWYDTYVREIRKVYPKELMDNIEFIKWACMKNHLPMSKVFMKYYTQNDVNISKVWFLKRIGIAQLSHMQTILGANTNFSNIGYDYRKDSINAYSRKELKRMVKERGEKFVTKILSNQRDLSLFIDYSRMKKMVEEADASLLPDMTSMSIQKMHNVLIPLANAVQFINKPISYSKETLQKEIDIDGFIFRFAKDTNELVKIGQEMRICVGSYRNRALSGSSQILTVQSEDKYHACIELDKTGKCFIQIKAWCNNMVKGKCANAIRDWAKKFAIKTNCYDYRNMDSTEPESCYDYHQLELHDGYVF